MSSLPIEFASTEAQRAELETVLRSERFARAPTLAHLLSYLCEKAFAGQSGQIKEYSIAVDVFGRQASFDQDADSIVRVQANRLRKRLADYYAAEGANHRIRISIPVGQYVPVFEQRAVSEPAPDAGPPAAQPRRVGRRGRLWLAGLAGLLIVVSVIGLLIRQRKTPAPSSVAYRAQPSSPESWVGLPVGDEVRILAGAGREYVDRAGKLWSADRYFNGGAPVRSSVQYIWRTQDRELYRASRQGEFSYDIPLKPGIYELRLHFAETFYGPEEPGGGGEGSRVIAVSANGKPLLTNLDVVADADGSRTADVKVFTDIAPAADGQLHLSFSSVHGGRAMVSAIEILPGLRGRIRPVRVISRDSAYYDNDSRWWAPDAYFKGGQLATRGDTAVGTDDPEFYEAERWGRFSYAIPVPPGRYTVALHFIEHRFGPGSRDAGAGPPAAVEAGAGSRVFNVFCNGKLLLRDLDIFREAGADRPMVRKFTGLEPNAQGKLLLEFVPLKDYATVTAIEVLPE